MTANSVDAAQKNNDLANSKVSCHRVLLGQCKNSRTVKTIGHFD